MNMIESGKISTKQSKEVLYHVIEREKEPSKIVEELGITQIGSDDEIKKIIDEVMEENPNAKEQYKGGRTNIIDYLVGQVMKKTRGRANPAITMNLIKEEMEK